MIEKYLGQYEGKTIEFKENTEFLDSIIRTVIAFANTAGGVILIGVADAARQVVGLSDVRKEELRISNAIANSIMPLIRPDIDVVAYRNKEIILIRVYHGAGPYYLQSAGPEKGVYVRIGSTNRVADDETTTP